MTLRFAVIWDRETPAWQQDCVALLARSGVGKLVNFGEPNGLDRARAGMTASLRRPREKAASGSSKLESDELASLYAGSADRVIDSDVSRLDFVLVFANGQEGTPSLPPCQFGHWKVEFTTQRNVGATRHPVFSVSIVASELRSSRGQHILWRGHFPILASRRRTLTNAVGALPEVYVRLCREMELHGMSMAMPADEPTSDKTARGVPTRPPVQTLMAYVRRLFFLEIWNVGIVEAKVETLLDTTKYPVQWLPEQGRCQYIADPFPHTAGGSRVVLVEEFDHWRPKGRITAKLLSDGASQHRPVVVFDFPCHLSYPYLLEWNGQTFCIPEMHEAGLIQLYRATLFPSQWEHVATLVHDFPAIDPTVFRHGGLWWLLASKGGAVSTDRLYGWYAEQLEGPWTSHPLNPLKCDVRSSRPAGRPFVVQGRLIRPAQDCSASYGGAVTFNHVAVLTSTEFREDPVGALLPDPKGAYPDGLHTVCGLDDVTFIDGKRYQFSLLASVINMRQRWLGRQRYSDLAPPPSQTARGTPGHADGNPDPA